GLRRSLLYLACGIRAYVVERMVRVPRKGHSYGVSAGAAIVVSIDRSLLRSERGAIWPAGSPRECLREITLRLSHLRPGDSPPHSSESRCQLCRCQTDYSSAPCYR